MKRIKILLTNGSFIEGDLENFWGDDNVILFNVTGLDHVVVERAIINSTHIIAHWEL